MNKNSGPEQPDLPKLPIALSWPEMNVILTLRKMQFGELTISIANKVIKKIKPNSSFSPTKEAAAELLQLEMIKKELKVR